MKFNPLKGVAAAGAAGVRAATGQMDLPSWVKQPGRSNKFNQATISANGVTATFWATPPRAETEIAYDEQRARGSGGARQPKTGVQPAKPQVKIYVWTGTDEDRWDKFAPFVNPKLRKERETAAKIQHPSLNRFQITDVLISQISEELNADENGVLTIIFTFREGKYKTGKSKVAKVVDWKMPTAFDEGDRLLKDVRATVQGPQDEVEVP